MILAGKVEVDCKPADTFALERPFSQSLAELSVHGSNLEQIGESTGTLKGLSGRHVPNGHSE